VVGDHQHCQQYCGKQSCQGADADRGGELADIEDFLRREAAGQRRNDRVDRHQCGRLGIIGSDPCPFGNDEIADDDAGDGAKEAGENCQINGAEAAANHQAGHRSHDGSDEEHDQKAS